jgi:hypothetical protein
VIASLLISTTIMAFGTVASASEVATQTEYTQDQIQTIQYILREQLQFDPETETWSLRNPAMTNYILVQEGMPEIYDNLLSLLDSLNQAMKGEERELLINSLETLIPKPEKGGRRKRDTYEEVLNLVGEAHKQLFRILMEAAKVPHPVARGILGGIAIIYTVATEVGNDRVNQD